MFISKFPNWVSVNEGVRPFIDTVANTYQFSDYTFSNLHLWDLDNKARVSLLNENLALMISDYSTGEPCYSFIGKNMTTQTAETLLDYAYAKNGVQILKIVPEVGIEAMTARNNLIVEEDPDNHDYILDLPKLAARSGRSLQNLRGSFNQFSNAYGDTSRFISLDVYNPKHQHRIMDVFELRSTLKVDHQFHKELEAVKRLFKSKIRFHFNTYGLEVAGKLIAFIITEPFRDAWALAHFWKADTTYKGAYSYLISRVAEDLAHKGIYRLNFEQDLGIEGLRRAKHLLRPSGVLKKYTICKA